jgi:hypothetical protein
VKVGIDLGLLEIGTHRFLGLEFVQKLVGIFVIVTVFRVDF